MAKVTVTQPVLGPLPAPARQSLQDAISDCLDAGMSALDVAEESQRAAYAFQLAAVNGNRSKLATLLGVHRNTLTRRLDELGIAVAPGARGQRARLLEWKTDAPRKLV